MTGRPVGSDEPLIVVSQGDPVGIGPEIALAAWQMRHDGDVPPFAVVGTPKWLAHVSDVLSAGPVVTVSTTQEARHFFDQALPVFDTGVPVGLDQRFGVGDRANAPAVVAAIRQSVARIQAEQAAALVTLPINKQILGEAGFPHPGHTDFLGELARDLWPDKPAHPVMMLASSRLRVVPVTVHVALRQAIDSLNEDMIVTTARTTAEALWRDFGINRPRLAISGLNPHAGEGGLLGFDEARIIAPAIQTLKDEGIDANGPFPADTLFHDAARDTYDAAVCMTHDQALIPIKTLDFDSAVNVTLGLPFVRTSPDHGTAYNLAGTGRASPASFIAALRLARDMVLKRLGAF